MAQGKSSVGFWVLISTILVGGGIGAYFLLRKPKEEKEGDDETISNDTPSSETPSSTPSSTPQSFTFPFKTESEGNTFRAWVIAKDPTFAKSISLDATGKLNSYVQKAWDKYGTEYSKKTPSTPSNTSSSSSNKDIDIIVKKASGDLTERSKLAKRPAEYLKNWANALKNNRSAFIFANQVYKAKTGERILESNPINKVYYAKNGGAIGHLNEFTNTGSLLADIYAKGEKVGKATGVAFVGGSIKLYISEPNTSTIGSPNKWFKFSDLTSTKPKSSFDGGNNQVEFSSFDNNFDLNL